MKAIAAVCLLAAIVAAGASGVAAQQPVPVDAEALFAGRCKSCHEPAGPRTPGREQMRSLTYQEITEALIRGVMAPMAQGLTPAEINALSRLLGGREAEGQSNAPAPAAGRGPAPAAAPVVIKPASPNVVAALLAKLRPVTAAMLNNPAPEDWLHWGGAYEGQNFSPLNRINRGNVKNMAPAWRTPLQPGASMPAPLVHDGVMFLQTTGDVILALDATNGELLWRYAPPPGAATSQKMGLALGGGRLFAPSADLSVIALDVKTGRKAWEHSIQISAPATNRRGFSLRSAPLVVGDTVIQGVTGLRSPGGNYIIGLDIATGREKWRFHTIARPGEPGGESWNGLPLERRSGGSVWHQGTYDEESKLVYFGISQTYDTAGLALPVTLPGVTRDALYTDSTVALNPETGKLVWHYQHLQNDQWDMDWVFERQVATMRIGGSNRRVVMTIGKIGILDALDAKTGAYLFSVDLGTQNLVTAIDPVTGVKTTDPKMWPDMTRTTLICPTASGARSWPTTAYSPRTNMVYVPVTEWCMTMGPQGLQLMTAPGSALAIADHPDAIRDGMMSRLQAIDLSGRKLGWKHDLSAPLTSAVLATAGGVVFTVDLDPALKAFDDRDGKLLWSAPLDNIVTSSVISYAVGAKQYVAVVTGLRNNYTGDLTNNYAAFRRNRGLPPRPALTGAPAIQVFALPS